MFGKRIALAAAAALVLVPAALAGKTSAHSAHVTSIQTLDSQVLVALNQIRAQHGLVPLKLNPQLTTAAYGHTSEMLADGYFEHNSFDGSPFWKRLTGYTNGSPNGYWSVGENLLWSAPDVDATQAMQLWMASPEHRKNILTARWRDIGIAALHTDSASGDFGSGAVTVITTDFGVR